MLKIKQKFSFQLGLNVCGANGYQMRSIGFETKSSEANVEMMKVFERVSNSWIFKWEKQLQKLCDIFIGKK